MFTARGWSYSSSRRRRQRGAYRVGQRPSGVWRAAVLVLPVLVATGMVGLVAWLPAASDASLAEIAGSPTPLAAALRQLPTEPPTIGPAPPPTLAPTVAPALAPTAASALAAALAPSAASTLQAGLAPTVVSAPAGTLAPILATQDTTQPLLPGHRILAYYGNPLAKE